MWNRKRRKTDEKEAVKLPEDVVYGDLVVSVTGSREMYVENYRAILGYTDERIEIQGRKEKMTVEGKDFLIQYFTNDDMRITGKIDTVRYSVR